MITSDLNHRTETEAHLQKGADWLLACYLEGAAKRQTLDVFMRADADARFESAQIAARQGDTARVRPFWSRFSPPHACPCLSSQKTTR